MGFYDKFSDLKNFVGGESIPKHMAATRKASTKLLKTLLNSAKDLQDAAEEAADSSAWGTVFKEEMSKIKSGMDKQWNEIKHTWGAIVKGESANQDEETENKDKGKKEKRFKDKNRKNKEKDDWKEKNRKSSERFEKDDDDDDWLIQRGKERAQRRSDDEKAEWLFQRAKQRETERVEERRGDWYNDRQRRREDHEDNDNHSGESTRRPSDQNCHGKHCRQSKSKQQQQSQYQHTDNHNGQQFKRRGKIHD